MVLPIIHSLHTRCHGFQFSCADHSVYLTADLQVVMVFHIKKANKTKKTHPISAYQESKIILNKELMISHAKAVSRAASIHSSQLLLQQWEKFGFRRASAGCLGCWMLPCEQLWHQKWHFPSKFLQLFLHFSSLVPKSEDAASLTQALYCHQ